MKVSDYKFCTCSVGQRCNRCTPAAEVPEFLRLSETLTRVAVETGAQQPMTAAEVLQRQSPPVGNANVACDHFGPLAEFVSTRANESILQEAHRLTQGPRHADYGHPLEDYTCTAAIASALLSRKLKEPITPDEMALLMVGVKLSRQSRQKKRDNTVDGAGYFWVAQECLDEQERRKTISTTETK